VDPSGERRTAKIDAMPGKNLRLPIEFPSPCACRYGPEPGAPSHRPVRSSSVLPLSNMPSKDPGRCLLVRTPGAHRANRLLSFPPAPAVVCTENLNAGVVVMKSAQDGDVLMPL
jgi:hypothetical protein